MPPKKTQLKGGLFDPASMNMTLMTAPKISMLDNGSEATNYSSKNYMNVQAGGAAKLTKKQSTKASGSKTNKQKKTKK